MRQSPFPEEDIQTESLREDGAQHSPGLYRAEEKEEMRGYEIPTLPSHSGHMTVAWGAGTPS